MIDLNTHEQFILLFPNNESCKNYIITNIYNGSKCCPYCDNYKIYIMKAEKNYPNGRLKCANSKCYKRFTITTGTELHACNIDLHKLFYLLWLYSKSAISTWEATIITGITQKTTWFRKAKVSSIIKMIQKENKTTYQVFYELLTILFVHDKLKLTRIKKINDI